MGAFSGMGSVAWAVTPFLGLEVRHAYGDAKMWWCGAAVGVRAGVVGVGDCAGDGQLVGGLGDDVCERSQSDAISSWDSGALVFVTEVPDPENFGVPAYGADGRVTDIVEKAGWVDKRYDTPPSNDAIVGLYCYPPDVFDIIETLAPSNRGELEITDVNRA